MAKLILHIGPAKCGSTSIQQFFRNQPDPCRQQLRFVLMDPAEIAELNKPVADEASLVGCRDLLLGNRQGVEALVVSHEYLFQCPLAVRRICETGQSVFSEIMIIGYCRRQGDFLVSAYSQWLFRAPRRIQEVNAVLHEHGLDATFFSGLERQLIASIMNEFYSARQLSEYAILDWSASYQNLAEQVEPLGSTINCGVLPGRNGAISLVEDFCARAGLELHRQLLTVAGEIANMSYHPDIIEAINCAVVRQRTVPGPHESNDRLEELSSLLEADDVRNTAFIGRLKAYVDSYFHEANLRLCTRFGLNPDYFAAQNGLSKVEIIDCIRREQDRRRQDPLALLEKYKMIAARMVELCCR